MAEMTESNAEACERCGARGRTWRPTPGKGPELLSADLCDECVYCYQDCRFLVYITDDGRGFVKPTDNASAFKVMGFEEKICCPGQKDFSRPILLFYSGKPRSVPPVSGKRTGSRSTKASKKQSGKDDVK